MLEKVPGKYLVRGKLILEKVVCMWSECGLDAVKMWSGCNLDAVWLQFGCDLDKVRIRSGSGKPGSTWVYLGKLESS